MIAWIVFNSIKIYINFDCGFKRDKTLGENTSLQAVPTKRILFTAFGCDGEAATAVTWTTVAATCSFGHYYSTPLVVQFPGIRILESKNQTAKVIELLHSELIVGLFLILAVEAQALPQVGICDLSLDPFVAVVKVFQTCAYLLL